MPRLSILAALTLCLLPAAVPADAALLLDMAGDGLDLSGTVTTTLLSGSETHTRWTVPMSDDCFLIVDADSLLDATGIALVDGTGAALHGNTLFRDGLRVRGPGGKETVVTDGWQMLGAMDTNGDGTMDPSDAAWPHLRLYMDDDVDGRIVNQELHRPETALMLSVDTAGGPPYGDALGNTRSDGDWTDELLQVRVCSDVTFADVPVPAAAASWGAVKRGPRGSE